LGFKDYNVKYAASHHSCHPIHYSTQQRNQPFSSQCLHFMYPECLHIRECAMTDRCRWHCWWCYFCCCYYYNISDV